MTAKDRTETTPRALSLHIRSLHKLRGERHCPIRIEVPALDLAAGEVVAIQGGNGSGKSTLLDMLGLILSPDAAAAFTLTLDGERRDLTRVGDSARARLRRRCLSYVLQTGGLLEFLSLRENIRLGAALAGRSQTAVDALAAQLGIGDVLAKRPGKVSGGQRQKAAVARALIQAPPMILADEPTAAMDPPSIDRVIALLRDLAHHHGSAIVVVTHDADLAARVADRLLAFRPHPSDSGPLRSVLEAA